MLLGYAIRRVLWVVPVVLGASIVAFTIMHVAPGSPWNREGRQLSPEMLERLTAEFGLDQPLPIQYLAWLSHLIQGDFGLGMSTNRYEVAEVIGQAIGPTLLLCMSAFVLAVAVGVPLGLVAALRRRTPIGHAATGLALLGMAAPAFALAGFLQVVFAPDYGAPPGPLTVPPDVEATFREWVLPIVALAGLPMA